MIVFKLGDSPYPLMIVLILGMILEILRSLSLDWMTLLIVALLSLNLDHSPCSWMIVFKLGSFSL